MDENCHTHLFFKTHLQQLALGEGLEGIEVRKQNKTFDVLKQNLNIMAVAIFCKFLKH